MIPASFTEKQQGHARLAQALRELSPYAVDIQLGTVNDGACEIPIIWRAENIRQVLGDAADLIDELTIKAGG